MVDGFMAYDFMVEAEKRKSSGMTTGILGKCHFLPGGGFGNF